MKNQQLENEIEAIERLLKRFKAGYQKRNIEEVEHFVANTFYNSSEVLVLGTGTGELEIGYDQIIELVKGDWQYWGDVELDTQEANIQVDGNIAWFYLPGHLVQSFQHSKERNENYLNFVKDHLKDEQIKDEQKVALLNWVLTLTYHQRNQVKRDYNWPLGMSGLVIKKNDVWRIQQLHFAMGMGNYPDERIEHHIDFVENNRLQNEKAKEYFGGLDKGSDIYSFLEKIQNNYKHITECIGEEGLFIGPRLEILSAEKLQSHLKNLELESLSFHFDSCIHSEIDDKETVVLTGVACKQKNKEDRFRQGIEEMDAIFEKEMTVEDKLFQIHRSVSSILMETSSGDVYSWPFRVTAVLSKNQSSYQIESAHISCPHYWIFEGKI